MRVISFSLWGDRSIYMEGALDNVDLARVLYPSWVCRFYCHIGVCKDIIKGVVDRGADIVMVDEDVGTGMLWRFGFWLIEVLIDLW